MGISFGSKMAEKKKKKRERKDCVRSKRFSDHTTTKQRVAQQEQENTEQREKRPRKLKTLTSSNKKTVAQAQLHVKNDLPS